MDDLCKILSSVNDAAWAFDLKSKKFIFINNQLAELYQTLPEDMEESPLFWLKYVHPDDLQYALTESKCTGGGSIEMEYRLARGEDIKWVSDKRVVLLDADGNPNVITGILSDISTKNKADVKLPNPGKTYRYLFVNNPNPLWIYDLKTLRFLAVNNAAVAKYGYSKEEFLSMTIADIRPADDHLKLIEHVGRVKNTFSSPDKCWQHLKKNGQVLYVKISGHGINYQGRAAEIVMVHDITLEIRSKERIALAKENLDTLINSLNDDIWSIDSNYRLISANNSYKKTIEQATGREVAIGDPIFLNEYSLQDIKLWKKYYDKALSGHSFTFIEMVNMPGKKSFCAEIKMNPIKVGNEIIGVACLSTNIEERLTMQEDVLIQNRKLREIISLASHDIRGPVASLLSLTAAFNTENLADPFNQELIQLIGTMTKNLDEILHDLVEKTYSLKKAPSTTNLIQYNKSGNE